MNILKTGYVRGPQHLCHKLNTKSQDYVISKDILCRIQNSENKKALQPSL